MPGYVRDREESAWKNKKQFNLDSFISKRIFKKWTLFFGIVKHC